MKLVLKPILLVTIVFTSTPATADTIIDHRAHDISAFNKEMSKIVVVNINEAVTVPAYYLDDVVEVTEFMSQDTQLKKISNEQAKKLGLIPFKLYFAYSPHSINELSEKASIKRMKNNPPYFSATRL